VAPARCDARPLADYLRLRYSPAIERLAALLIVPTSLFWAAAQIRAFGIVLHSIGSVDLATGIALAAWISIVYTMLGGVLADIVTDVVQGVIIVIGLVWLFASVAATHGGLGAALATIDTSRIRLTGGEQPSWFEVAEAWAIPLFGAVLAPELLSRGLAARSAATARWSMLGGGAMYLTIGLMPVVLGLLGPRLLPALQDPDQLLPELAKSHLSQVGAVVLVGALVSAILSTIDSAMLVAGSLLSRNVLLAGRDVGDRVRLRTVRACVLTLGVVAWLLATTADSVFGLIEESSGFGSAGIFVCVSFGLFSRLGGPRAAAAAMIAGAAVWALKYVPTVHDRLPWLAEHPFLCALAAALAAFLVAAHRRAR